VGDAISRRDFLKNAGRILALGGVGAIAAIMLTGARKPRAQTCVSQGVCRGCAVFNGCGLPAALSARQRAPWARAAG
jgi:hypothetical protein